MTAPDNRDAGAACGRAHSMKLRVYDEDTDASGRTAGRAAGRRACAPRSVQPQNSPFRHRSSKRRHKRPPSMQSLQTAALPGTVSSNLSIFDLFLQSDTIVKLVMFILLLASFW